jgi:uncharacterized protein YdaU (DUF1376 family)
LKYRGFFIYLTMKKTYFLHQSDSFTDYKIIKMRSKLGIESYGIFWAVLELLFKEENKLCIDDYEPLAYSLQCDADKLKAVIEDFDLFVIEDGCFYSKRLNEHIEEINNKSNKAKENAAKRWNNANAMPSHSKRNASISISNSKSININKRIEDFKKSIHAIEGISDEDKNDFFLYWTEKNKSGSKFRAEMQRTFDINLRLKRWSANGFSKSQKSKFPEYYDEYTYKKLDNKGQQEYVKHLKDLGFETVYSPTAGTVWRKKHKV